ncbi:MAG: esterase/lipase family protein, partial [Phycisphaerae bacterium]
YGNEHFTCFQFDYDWRRNNVENARRLHEFILDKKAYIQDELKKRYDIENADFKFDLVAHSMGGLIARYYIRYGPAALPVNG